MSKISDYKLQCFEPLIYFTCDTDEISLNDVKIRKYSEKDNKNIRQLIQRNIISDTASIGWAGAINHKWYLKQTGYAYLIEFPFTLKVENIIDISPCMNKARLILTILRLFKSGQIGISWIYVFFKDAEIETGNWTGQYNPQYTAFRTGKKYHIAKDDVPKLTTFYQEIEKPLKCCNKTIDRSMRWFNKSYFESKLEDKFIDLFIALESLYKAHQSFKLSISCAYAIGTDEDKMEDIKYNIEEAYLERNKIVHGGTPKKEKIENLTPKLEEYTRASLIEVIKSENQENYLMELEKNICRGIKRTSS